MGEADFWKDQESAQKTLQRRKRVESDLGLLKRLRTQEDDTRVLVEWLEAGEDVGKDLGSGSRDTGGGPRSGRVPEDARRASTTAPTRS